MKNHLIPIILAGILLLAFAVTGEAQDPVDLLKKSYAAESKVTLTGRLRTTLHEGARSVSSDVNIHRDGRRMRMEYVSGASSGSVIIDDGRSMTKLMRSTRTAYVSQTPEAPDRLDLLLANYRPIMSGSGKVAGRDCYILRVQPRNAGNPSRKLWIDKSSLVALKTERYNSDGKLTMSTEFTRADFNARPSASLFTVPGGWRTVRLAGDSGDNSLDSVRKAVGFAPIRPSYVPKGYGFDGYYTREAASGVRFAGLRYTDGMNTISIFQRRAAGARGMGGGRGLGRGQGPGQGRQGSGASEDCLQADNPGARMVRTTSGVLTIILVADISTAELQRVAGSFR